MFSASLYLLVSFTLLESVPSVTGVTGVLQCYTCASVELRDSWQMTSFPNRIADVMFSDELCQDPTNLGGTTPPQGFLSTCNSACVTMILQRTSANGVPNQNLLYVRGCHDYLVGKVDSPVTAMCQRGNIRRMDVEGKAVQTDAQLRYCTDAGVSGSACNRDTGFSTEEMCAKQPLKTVTCDMCTASSDECDEHNIKQCTGQFCGKAAGHIQDQEFITKTCSPFNPYGTAQSACRRIKSQLYISSMRSSPEGNRTKRGITFNYDATHCFCDTDNCNSASSFTFSVFTIFTASAYVMLSF